MFHGRKGELARAYYDGMEGQLSALGLVLNAVVLWNSVYLDRALAALREQGHPVLDDDVARLSPFMRRHIGIDGHYSFHLPDFGGAHRPLRDPHAVDASSAPRSHAEGAQTPHRPQLRRQGIRRGELSSTTSAARPQLHDLRRP